MNQRLSPSPERFAPRALWSFGVSCFVVLVGSAPTWAVDLLVPTQYPTIQEAIELALDGDRVLVSPGVYPEVIDFLGKAIVVESVSGPDVTTINASSFVDVSVVSFVNGEGADSVLQGFGITGGTGAVGVAFGPVGGGVRCEGASPTITGNRIFDNSVASPVVSLAGAGIFCGANTAPVIRGNEFLNNHGTWGGGILCDFASQPIIEDNTFTGNEAARGGAIYCGTDALPAIRRNVFHANHASFLGGSVGGGGGIYLEASSPVIAHNTFFQNSAADLGGALFGISSSPVVVNCIFWDNPALMDTGLSFWQPLNEVVEYCLVDGGWPGTGNFSADPLFVDAAADNFRLQAISPCVDAGDPTSPPDPDGTIADLGAFFFSQEELFVRGDCNGDGSLNIADAIGALGLLFNPGGLPPCSDACDANDDGSFNIADIVAVLEFLFDPGTLGLPEPFGGCGPDPTVDTLDCMIYVCP